MPFANGPFLLSEEAESLVGHVDKRRKENMRNMLTAIVSGGVLLHG